MAPVGDYHGCSHVFDYSPLFLVSLPKPVTKQAFKKIFVDYITMLPITPDSFCYGIYKDYNHRKSALTLKLRFLFLSARASYKNGPTL